MKAHNLMEQSKYKLAAGIYQACPPSPRVSSGLGTCFKMLKKFDLAVENYTYAIKLMKKPQDILKLKI